MTYFECLKTGIVSLEKEAIEDAEFDARELLIFAANISRSNFFSSMHENVDEVVSKKFFELIEERKKGTPLQYIIGSWDFYGLEFLLGPGVLIPRPETEILVDLSIEHLKRLGNESPVVFDLCAGTGCVGISIASNIKGAKVYEFEYSDDAFKYLEKNLKDNCIAIKYDVLKGPYEFMEKYNVTPDIIVSNPPYIRTEEIRTLQKEVKKEPLMALDGGEDGLIFYRAITDKWIDILNPSGLMAVECGEDQANDIEKMFSVKINDDFYDKFSTVFKMKDFAGVNRVVGLK